MFLWQKNLTVLNTTLKSLAQKILKILGSKISKIKNEEELDILC